MFLYSVDWSVFMLRWNSVLGHICKDFCCTGIYDHGVWHGQAYSCIASYKCPAPVKGPPILFLHILYTAENVEFLDTPVHIHVHVVTMHEYKTIMMLLIVGVQQIMV